MPTSFSTIPLFGKSILMRLTLYHWQPCILQFSGITKDILQRSTGSLGLHVFGVVAKLLNLVLGYSLLPVDNRVS